MTYNDEILFSPLPVTGKAKNSKWPISTNPRLPALPAPAGFGSLRMESSAQPGASRDQPPDPRVMSGGGSGRSPAREAARPLGSREGGWPRWADRAPGRAASLGDGPGGAVLL